MKVSAITVLIWLALAATAIGQAKSSSNATSSSAPSKASLSEVRAIVRELEGHTEKLRELLSNHGALVERRPELQGSGPESKKSYDEQLAKWESALDRQLDRIDSARAALIEATQRLDKSITGELPTGLGKDVARVRNEAEPERQMAEQVLAKRKAKPKQAKQAPAAAKPAPSNNEDYDL